MKWQELESLVVPREHLSPEAMASAVALARSEGRDTADSLYGAREDALHAAAAMYYDLVLTEAFERGVLTGSRMQQWQDAKIAHRFVEDPRVFAFAIGLRERVFEWATVRRIGGEPAVRASLAKRLQPDPEEATGPKPSDEPSI